MKSHATYRHRGGCRRQARVAGFSLVELMIALVLGLILISGVIGIFISSRVVYKQNENLARIQENMRYAFVVLGRDIREAGGILCSSNLPTANVLNNPTANWWSDWGDGLHGYDGNQAFSAKAFGTNTAERISGTDAVVIHNATQGGVLITDHQATSAQFKVNTKDHGIATGDVLLACDNKQAAIFMTTNASSSNVTIVHNTGTGTPGNCSKGLGYPTECTTLGNRYSFEDGGFITKLSATAWYIGANGRGGSSLYRVRLGNNGTQTAEEVVENCTDLQIDYLLRSGGTLASSYVSAASVTDWTQVVAARVMLTLASAESVGTDGNVLTRTMLTTYQLRNREI